MTPRSMAKSEYVISIKILSSMKLCRLRAYSSNAYAISYATTAFSRSHGNSRLVPYDLSERVKPHLKFESICYTVKFEITI